MQLNFSIRCTNATAGTFDGIFEGCKVTGDEALSLDLAAPT